MSLSLSLTPTSDSRFALFTGSALSQIHTGLCESVSVTLPSTCSKEHLTLANKMRKPMVEKMRRDRINSSVEQLKSLLGSEFLSQNSSYKQEKADILEMTVCFLRRLQQSAKSTSCASAVSQGYSRSVQEAVSFLSHYEVKTLSQRRLLSHFQNQQPTSDKGEIQFALPQPSYPAYNTSSKEETPASSAPWRPWQSPADFVQYCQTHRTEYVC